MSAKKRRAQSRVPGRWRVGLSRYKLQSVSGAAVLPNYNQVSTGGVTDVVTQQELILGEGSDQSKRGHPCPLVPGEAGTSDATYGPDRLSDSSGSRIQ